MLSAMYERGCSIVLGILLTVGGLALAFTYFDVVEPQNWDGAAAIPLSITGLGVLLILYARRKDDA